MKKTCLLFSLLLLLTACGRREPLPEKVELPLAPLEEPTEVYPVTLCLPNEAADGFFTAEGMLFSNDAQALTDALVTYGALPEGTVVLSFGQDGEDLSLDLSEEFMSALTNTGTAGEQMVLGSLVCTFLTNYEAQRLHLTCEGKIVQTGHNIYDWPLTTEDFLPG